jgi:peptidoglycan hydrolase-like protein with peptidoglycan-binding domain
MVAVTAQPVRAQSSVRAGGNLDGGTPSLERVAQGGASLRRGMSGPSVEEGQQLLKDAGYNVAVDGHFGPQSDRAVRQFQADRGLTVDGKLGPQTLAALREVPGAPTTPPPVVKDGVDGTRAGGQTSVRAPTQQEREARPAGTVRAGDLASQNRPVARQPAATTAGAVGPAPAGASERERYDHYAAIIRANGGQVCANGQPTVLGVRGMGVDGTRHGGNSTRQYDEMMVVLTPDGRCQEFRGATHPGQRASRSSPDVTGDGAGDVGRIQPGNYQVVPNGPHGGAASFHVRTLGGSGSLPGVRDTNQDGRFSAEEAAASGRRGDTLTQVLFHQGGTNTPTSIGCQTLAPNDYRRFVEMLGGSRARFSYTLVDGGA